MKQLTKLTEGSFRSRRRRIARTLPPTTGQERKLRNAPALVHYVPNRCCPAQGIFGYPSPLEELLSAARTIRKMHVDVAMKPSSRMHRSGRPLGGTVLRRGKHRKSQVIRHVCNLHLLCDAYDMPGMYCEYIHPYIPTYRRSPRDTPTTHTPLTPLPVPPQSRLDCFLLPRPDPKSLYERTKGTTMNYPRIDMCLRPGKIPSTDATNPHEARCFRGGRGVR